MSYRAYRHISSSTMLHRGLIHIPKRLQWLVLLVLTRNLAEPQRMYTRILD